MGVDFKDAYKTFIQGLDDGAQPLDAENPYKFQLTKNGIFARCKGKV